MLPDSSPSVLDQLCAPFPSELFPRHFNPAEITSLLNTPFAASVPVTESEFLQYQPLCPGFFRADQTMSAVKLAQRLAEALYKDWPLGTPSELLYTPFWDSVGFQFPKFAGRVVGVSLVENRYVLFKQLFFKQISFLRLAHRDFSFTCGDKLQERCGH